MGEGGVCQNLPACTVLTVYFQCWFFKNYEDHNIRGTEIGWEVYKNISKSLYYDHKFSINLKLPPPKKKVTCSNKTFPGHHLKQGSSLLDLSYPFTALFWSLVLACLILYILLIMFIVYFQTIKLRENMDFGLSCSYLDLQGSKLYLDHNRWLRNIC